ncbi:MAG: hypothetical protein J7M26_03925, partial [Armatimonadetes bacterium]|nr:hypothetical protein [Armatimonadota bacterium]
MPGADNCHFHRRNLLFRETVIAYNQPDMLDFLQLAIAATVEAVALVLLSRLLFVAGYSLLGRHRWRFFKLLWHLFRLPGNLLHELSHAVVLLLAGFRVEKIRPSLLDRSGTGHVEVRGRLWEVGPATPLV